MKTYRISDQATSTEVSAASVTEAAEKYATIYSTGEMESGGITTALIFDGPESIDLCGKITIEADGKGGVEDYDLVISATYPMDQTGPNYNTYDYATDAEMGEIEAQTVEQAYAKLRHKITDRMIEDGASLWVENSDPDSKEPRLTLGENAD